MTGMDTQITRVPTTTGDDGNGFDQQLSTAQQDDPPVPTYPNLRQAILYDDFDTNDAFAPAQGAPVSVMTDADDETHKGLNTDHVFFGTLGGLGMALVGGSLRSTAADQKNQAVKEALAGNPLAAEHLANRSQINKKVGDTLLGTGLVLCASSLAASMLIPLEDGPVTLKSKGQQ